MRIWFFGLIVTVLLVMTGCSPQDSTTESSAQPIGSDVPTVAPVTFIDRVWVVAESKQVSLGELRVFLSEGTLVMASTHGTPAFGTWTYRDGHLTITEDGIKYKVDILELTADVFRIRINSPGEPVDIRFKLAEPPPLPENVSENPERK